MKNTKLENGEVIDREKIISLMPATEGEMFRIEQEGFFYSEVDNIVAFITNALNQQKLALLEAIGEKEKLRKGWDMSNEAIQNRNDFRKKLRLKLGIKESVGR